MAYNRAESTSTTDILLPLIRRLCLLEIRSDYRELVASSSYCHTNGFENILLPDEETGALDLRIHVWGKGAFDCDIHTHNSPLISLVLHGEIEESCWIEEQNGEAYFRHRYSSVGAGGNGLFDEATEVYLSFSESRNIREGLTYVISQAQPHAVRNVSANETFTIVKKLEFKTEFSFVYKREGSPPPPIRIPMSEKRVNDLCLRAKELAFSMSSRSLPPTHSLKLREIN